MATTLAMMSLFMVSVFADDESSTTTTVTKTETAITKLPVYKTVRIATNSTIPDETFTFKIEPATVTDNTQINGITVKDGIAFTSNSEVSIGFGSSDNTSTGTEGDKSICEVTKDTYFDLTKVHFTNTGIYRYIVTEVPGTDSYITFDTKKYQVDLYVYKYGNSVGVGHIVLREIDLNENNEETINTEKPDKINFVNTVNVADLKIYKRVSGEEYTPDEEFSFYLSIPAGGDTITLTKGQTIHAEIYEGDPTQTEGTLVQENDITVRDTLYAADGKTVINDTLDTATFQSATYSQKFTLKANQYLKIIAPVSMIYFVEEADVTDEGYTQEYKYYENGNRSTVTIGSASTTTKHAAITTSADGTKTPVIVKGTVNTIANRVEFINSRELKPDTGINVDVTPFILITIIAVCSGILFFARKRRADR
jgi:hypothetical protein